MTDRPVTLDELAALDDEIAALAYEVEVARDRLAMADVALANARRRQARLIERYHEHAAAPLVDEGR